MSVGQFEVLNWYFVEWQEATLLQTDGLVQKALAWVQQKSSSACIVLSEAYCWNLFAREILNTVHDQ